MSYVSVRGNKEKKVPALPDDEEDNQDGAAAGGSANEDFEDEEDANNAGGADAKRPCDEKDLLPKCEVIHVSIVCAGVNATRSVSTLVKSILFYGKHPLHLHLVVDDVAELIMRKLFQTWRIKQCKFVLYRCN